MNERSASADRKLPRTFRLLIPSGAIIAAFALNFAAGKTDNPRELRLIVAIATVLLAIPLIGFFISTEGSSGDTKVRRASWLPRFRIRTLMFLVVAMGLLAGLFVWQRRLKERSHYFSFEAGQHASLEQHLRTMSALSAKRAEFARKQRAQFLDLDSVAFDEQEQLSLFRQFESLAEKERRLKERYQAAASRPWMRLPPAPE